MTQESQSSTKAAPQDAHSGIAEPMPQDVRAGGIKPTPQDARTAQELLDFIGECPSMFHTTSTIGKRLTTAGFAYLPETQPWNIEQGGTYYTTRNNSSVIAFKVGTSLDNYHFQITASHGDSPTFKVKSNAELTGPGESQRLNVEVYGGAVDYTWFDRPLGIAGRVMVKNGNRVESRLYESAEPLALIPSMPPHIQRDINQQFSPNRQVDLCPLFSAGALGKSTFDAIIADELGISKSDIVARDLFLVNRQQPCIWGAAGEFASSPKFDDLACAYTALEAFLAAENDRSISVFACFDNEEVGSNTKQGAMSTLLADTLSRLNAALGRSCEDLRCAIREIDARELRQRARRKPQPPRALRRGQPRVPKPRHRGKRSGEPEILHRRLQPRRFLRDLRQRGNPLPGFHEQERLTRRLHVGEFVEHPGEHARRRCRAAATRHALELRDDRRARCDARDPRTSGVLRR